MPTLGEKGAPACFHGDYDAVKQFIRKYKCLCTAYNLIDSQDKCDCILEYCSRSVRLFIESLTSYQNGNWSQLEDDILNYYDADLDDTQYIPDQLVKLVEKWQHLKISELTIWKRYQQEFFSKAGWLVSKGLINEDMQAGYFWYGIDHTFRKNIELHLLACNSHLGIDKAYPIKLVIQIAEELLERDRFEHDLVGANSKRPDWYTQSESDDSEDNE
ncbi:hypothetical protein BDN71DRAFT_1367797, partial [Pleurotus eryngii]